MTLKGMNQWRRGILQNRKRKGSWSARAETKKVLYHEVKEKRNFQKKRVGQTILKSKERTSQLRHELMNKGIVTVAESLLSSRQNNDGHHVRASARCGVHCAGRPVDVITFTLHTSNLLARWVGLGRLSDLSEATLPVRSIINDFKGS